ncbi:hypothetical protein HN958_02140 [Candidatus Falkowbacteria bacterium]|jgi:hypothetical protein|nr:hypothetical protein [Candidatus Falkowbacteria bacterium]MBT7007284.1 hypothetical protein [Candidatus Falkowbacteria bacterium]
MKMKKISILILVAIFVATLPGCTLLEKEPLLDLSEEELAEKMKHLGKNCSDETSDRMDCRQCVLRDGKIVMHGVGETCELPAKDAGKICVFDNECDKNRCVYENTNAVKGVCDEYRTDNETPNSNCHRKPDSDKPVCEEIFS